MATDNQTTANDSQTTSNDLVQFVQFAVQHLGSGAPPIAPEKLIQQWRENLECSETVEDIKRSLADVAAGRVQLADDAFEDIRRELGLDE